MNTTGSKPYLSMDGSDFDRLTATVQQMIQQTGIPSHQIRVRIELNGEIYITPKVWIDSERLGQHNENEPQPLKGRVGFSTGY